jgi:hypothetical protein
LPRKSDCFEKIQQLRQFYGDEGAARLLGVRVITLGYKDQLIPVVHLAYILHRMTFPTGRPVSLFQLITCGKYDRIPQETGPPDEDWAI